MTGKGVRMVLLLLEDDLAVTRVVEAYAMRQGYRVWVTTDSDAAFDAVCDETVDAAIVDLMLPGVSGWDVVEAMRRESALPIIVISALDALDRRIQLLRLGADDYLVKPFAPSELMARLAAVLRRTHAVPAEGTLRFGPFELDRTAQVLRRHGRLLPVTGTELALLQTLVENGGRTLTRPQLVSRLRAQWTDEATRAVDVHVAALRSKIEEDPHHPRWILTVWGVGYRFDPMGGS